ncbi:MAG: hypothetical protein JWN77_2394 [Frankiales bacterium]|jgi:hypothetical protein|nr:hypothetical protein [Frankiales bacterium]
MSDQVVVLLSAYSLVLLGVAQGLQALGRRSTSPWASRTLVGHLRVTGHQPQPLRDDDWPHSEVPSLYGGIAMVAALAAGALSLATLVLHHRGAVAALPLVVLGLSVLSLLRLGRSVRLRPAPGRQRDQAAGAAAAALPLEADRPLR